MAQARYEQNGQSRKRPADAQEDAWVAEEDQFVLRQAKKKAAIRVKTGRAKPIDWLAVILRALDTSKKSFDLDEDDEEVEIVDPEGVFEGLTEDDLRELEADIDTYLVLELEQENKEYWRTMQVICKDKLARLDSSRMNARGVSTVSADVDQMFAPKSYEQLETLEQQIRQKLRSDDDIDVDYWEHLLKTLLVFKGKAKLRKLSQAVISRRLGGLRKQQVNDAATAREKLRRAIDQAQTSGAVSATTDGPDPEPLLRLQPEDKALLSLDEATFLQEIRAEQTKVLKLGVIPMKQRQTTQGSTTKASHNTTAGNGNATTHQDISSSTAADAYAREVARGVNENEEVFETEEQITIDPTTHKWSDKYRPRKPKSFNRVQMGYEWNKYNQTHYDHDNPPPKVVQGYKFNVFYPDLIDKTKAPTYKITREGGRKRGQSFAPAGEEDTCVIRFVAGPPYEDVAFRIVDKEWDFSAKRERGFRSTFEKGVLQLHFQFKKVYYRK